MVNFLRKSKVLIIVGMFALALAGCGRPGNMGAESTQGTEEVKETETEFKIEIIDAEEILLKTWDAYAPEERFRIMGGHFTADSMDMPAKFDLTQTKDLTEMYCVPEEYVAVPSDKEELPNDTEEQPDDMETELDATGTVIDDAATMIDLYNAARFTAGVYHVTDAECVKDFITSMAEQVKTNSWLGERPEKLLVMNIDEHYVVSVYGRASLVDEFEEKLVSIYKTMVKIVVEENNF